MYRTSGLPPEVSGLPLTVAKYPASPTLAAAISLAGMKSALLTVPARDLVGERSQARCSTCLVKVVRAAPVGPLLATRPSRRRC